MAQSVKRANFFAPVVGAHFEELPGKAGEARTLLPVLSECALPLRIYKRPPPPIREGDKVAVEPEDFIILGDTTRKNEFRGVEEPRLASMNPYREAHYIVVYEEEEEGSGGGGAAGGCAAAVAPPTLCVLPLAGWMDFRRETKKEKEHANRVAGDVLKEETDALEAQMDLQESQLRPSAMRQLAQKMAEGGEALLDDEDLLEHLGRGGSGAGGVGASGGGGGGGGAARVSFRAGHGDAGLLQGARDRDEMINGINNEECEIFGQEDAAMDAVGMDVGDLAEMYGDDKAVDEEEYIATEVKEELEDGIALAEDAKHSWNYDAEEEGRGLGEEEVGEEKKDAAPRPAKRGRFDAKEDPQVYFRAEIPSFIIADGGSTNTAKLSKFFKSTAYGSDANARRIFLELVSELLNKDKLIDGTIVFTLKKKIT